MKKRSSACRDAEEEEEEGRGKKGGNNKQEDASGMMMMMMTRWETKFYVFLIVAPLAIVIFWFYVFPQVHYHVKPVEISEKRRLFHTAVTASDAVYNTWQCRIMYYWYKKQRELDGPVSEMGGFTRILHSGKPDNYMDEIPTFVANPLPPHIHKGYIVLNRPWAFVQWLQKANIKEDYILMAEPDHLIVKPIPNLATNDHPVAFQFSYIAPKENEALLRKFYPVEKGPITNIDPIGNAPVMIKKSLLQKISPTWMNTSLAMKNDTKANEAFGWVLEMYAYAIASALHGVRSMLYKDFMIHPPWEGEIGNSLMIHYTFGCDYNMKGEFTPGKIGKWRFDKRSYTEKPPPRNLSLPPNGVPESVVTIVKMVNEATTNIPNWES